MKSLLPTLRQVRKPYLTYLINIVLQQQFEDKQSPMGGSGGYQVDDTAQFSNLINELMRMNYH
jgi:hypothetical protein